jgi:hypothetical protein
LAAIDRHLPLTGTIMSFSLWTNDVCLGSLELARQAHAAHILHGHFSPNEPHAARVRELAVAVPCVGPWMLRDARQSNGVAAVNPLLVGTEFFALIADRVEVQSRRLALELRDADGDVVPTALIVVQGTHFGMDWIPLYRQATADWDASPLCSAMRFHGNALGRSQVDKLRGAGDSRSMSAT